MKKAPTILVLSVGIFLIPLFSLAHPGRTDSSGCHTCRTRCPSWGLSFGEYHCHRAKTLPQPKEPIRSTYGENGTGHTTPAPEYKNPQSKPLSNTTGKISIQDQIKNKINNEKDNYRKNPHQFRENLANKLKAEFGDNKWIDFYIYSLLPDIK